ASDWFRRSARNPRKVAADARLKAAMDGLTSTHEPGRRAGCPAIRRGALGRAHPKEARLSVAAGSAPTTVWRRSRLTSRNANVSQPYALRRSGLCSSAKHPEWPIAPGYCAEAGIPLDTRVQARQTYCADWGVCDNHRGPKTQDPAPAQDHGRDPAQSIPP